MTAFPNHLPEKKERENQDGVDADESFCPTPAMPSAAEPLLSAD